MTKTAAADGKTSRQREFFMSIFIPPGHSRAISKIPAMVLKFGGRCRYSRAKTFKRQKSHNAKRAAGRSLKDPLFHGERQKRDVSRALYRRGKSALVFGATAGNAPRQYLPALGNVAAQAVQVLIVDMLHFIGAEVANFSSDPSVFIFVTNQFFYLLF
jgi:hypothetical protein